MFGEFGNALLGDFHAALELEGKRLGDHGHGQDVHFLGELGDHRRRAGAGAPAHARSDEHHVGTLEHLDDPVAIFERGLPAHRGVRPRTEPLGHPGPELKESARS